MDTYGHLFPGQEADTVALFDEILTEDVSLPAQATGTLDASGSPQKKLQRIPQQSEHETARFSATHCDVASDRLDAIDKRKPLENKDQRERVRRGARLNDNTPGRTRTCDLRFRKPPPENVNTSSASTCELAYGNYSAYPSSQAQNEGADVRLQQIIDSWPLLPEAVRAGIVAMVKVVSNK